MNQARITRRRALHATMASSLVLAALAGCQTPVSQPLTGSEQAKAFPGTGGEQIVDTDARRYTASSSAQTIASATASVNASTAPRVYDGDLTSCWGSGTASNPSLTLTLSAAATLTELDIKVNPVGTYAIDVSNDGSSWTTAVASAKNSSWNVEAKTLPAGTSGKYVRLRFSNSGQQIMVFETTLMGSAASTVTPTAAPSAAVSTAPAGSLLASATSSQASFPAASAVDGNTDTQWAAASTDAAPSLTIDRGAASGLTAVGLKVWPNVAYSLSTSADGSTWTTPTSQMNTTWGVETKSVPAGTTARYIKLHFNSPSNAQVFEATPQGGGTTATPAPTTTATPAPTTTATPAPTTATPAPTQSSGPVPSANGVAIVVNPSSVLHAADSHILGTCRNHVAGQFANGPAKLAALKALTPTWGERKYLYRVGHGITDGRNDYTYMTGFHFEQVWNQTTSYPYDDIRGALNEADTIGADQMHVVNFGTSDPQEAGRYVSYLNHAGDANRAKYPVAQQNVGMFELGNEISWTMERGHDTYAPNETTYASRAKQFAQAMRANSDVPIKIGAVAGTNSNWMGNGWSGGATTVKNILQTMGSDVDFLIYHGYPSWPVNVAGNLDTYMAQNEWNRQKLENEIKPAIKQYAGGRDVYIANTENFDNMYSDATHAQGMFGAMYNADTVLLAMNEDIRTAVQFCFSHKGNADAAFFYNDDPTQTTPIYQFQQMLAQHWGDNIVATSGQNIPSKSVAGASVTVNMPKLSFSAATSGSTTYVMVLNRTNDSDVTSAVNVGFTPSSVTAYTLGGSSGWDSTTGSVSTTTGVNLNGITFKHATITILEISK